MTCSFSTRSLSFQWGMEMGLRGWGGGGVEQRFVSKRKSRFDVAPVNSIPMQAHFIGFMALNKCLRVIKHEQFSQLIFH